MHVFVFESSSLVGDHRFANQVVTIGSSPECTIALRDPRIKSEHLRLVPSRGGGWIAVPVDTVEPPSINGAPMRGEHHLREMDEIVLGPFVLRIYFSQFGGQQVRLQARAQVSPLPDGAVTRRLDEAVSFPLSRLHQLAAAAARVAAQPTIKDAAAESLRHALDQFSAAIACLRLRNHPPATGWHVHGLAADGRQADQPPVASLLHDHCTHQLTAVSLPPLGPCGAAMAVPLMDGANEVLGVLFVQRAEAGSSFENADLDALCAYSAVIAPALARAVDSPAIATATADETARVIQDAVTPATAPNWPGLQVAAYRRNGTTTVCDVYDLMRLANGTASFLIGRINATGAPLARLLAEAWTAFRTAGLHTDTPGVLMKSLNWLLHDGRTPCTIDAATLWINAETGAVQLCVAGTGVWAGLLPMGGAYRDVTVNHGPAAGASRGFPYAAVAFTLQPEDTLVAGTAGVDVLRNAAGAAMGRNGAIEILADLAGTSPSVMLSDLASELDQYSRGGATPDDFTVLAIRRV